MCRSDTEETKIQQKRAFPRAACRHILPLVGTYSLLRFLRAFAKRQALISSLPSHPHRARFYCLTLTCVLTSTVGFVQPLSPPCISFAVWR